MKKLFIAFLLISNICYSNQEFFIPKIPDNPPVVDKDMRIDIDNTFEKNSLFRELFELHFKTWKEEFNREIDKEEFLSNKKYNEIIKKNKEMQDERINNAILMLKKTIQNKQSQLAVVEASFKLSLFSYMTHKIAADEAINIINSALTDFKPSEENYPLFVRMNLFVADLLVINEKFNESQKYYYSILSLNLNKDIFKEELIRTHIGLGDSYYSLFKFEEASEHYLNSYPYFSAGWLLSEEKLALLLMQVKVRQIWALYRNSKFTHAADLVFDFSKEMYRYEKYIPSNVFNEVIRVSAYCLYELKNLELYKKFAMYSSYKEFNKKVIIKSFDFFTDAGYGFEVEKFATEIENDFISSKEFPYFMSARIKALKRINYIKKYYELSYYVTAYIARDSLWRSRFQLSKDEEEYRRELIERESMEAARYQYNEGIKNNSRVSFLKSAEVYHARIIENFKHDSKGELYQLYAQSLMQAGDLKEAYLAAEESLKYNLPQDLLKKSWFQLVNISRMQSQDSITTQDEKHIRYEKSVDGFFAAFPRDLQSHYSLYESAKRSELLSDYKNAKERYERLLSAPSIDLPHDNMTEKNNVTVSLSQLLIKMGAEQNDTVLSAGNLENISNNIGLSDSTKNIIEQVNSKLAFDYSEYLKNNGKLTESAQFLETWSKTYRSNPDSPKFLVQSIRAFAATQDWGRVLELAEYIEKESFLKSKLSVGRFWRAKALYEQLQFSSAAYYYEQAAINNDNSLTNEEKIQALEESLGLYDQLKLKNDSVRITQNLNKLKKTKIKIPKIFDLLYENEKMEEKFLKDLELFSRSKNLKFLVSAKKVKDKLENSIQKFKGNLKMEKVYALGSILLGQMNNLLSEKYMDAYHLNKRSNIKFYKYSKELQEISKKNMYQALLYEGLSNRDKVKIALNLKKYEKRDYHIDAEYKIIENVSLNEVYNEVKAMIFNESNYTAVGENK